ncbi:RING finger protein [Spirosoma arcticum]
MKQIFSYITTIISLVFCDVIIIGCGNSGTATERIDIKIIFTDIPSTVSDESGKLSDDARFLLSGLEADQNKCKRAFILNPKLVRPDLHIDTSISTKIERSSIAAATSTRDFKLVQQNLEELTLPDPILQKSTSKVKADSLFNHYVLTEAAQDSLLILFEEKAPDSLKINGKRYKVLANSGEVRNKILSVLCQNPKASFALLINPPVIESKPTLTLSLEVNEPDCQSGKITLTTTGGDGSPITFRSQGLSSSQKDNEFVIPKVQRNGKTFTFLATQNGVVAKVDYTTKCVFLPPPPPRRPISNRSTFGNVDNGDLSMIKNSEGCDICTRYYSATDKLGRTRQVTEKNSTFCCPCGKTIEMRGRTYRMECDGTGSNRLALVE